MIRKEFEFHKIQYLVYFPDNFSENKQYPVFFHLHGAGSRGRDFVEFEGSKIIDMLDKNYGPLSKAICVIPQCYADTWFDIFNDVLDLLKYVHEWKYVDKKRFVGSGISMGGYGIYQAMFSLPDLFTKAFVCCGGGMYWNIGRLKDIKFRIFHGQQDTTVFPEESQRMYNRLIEVGAEAKLTIYPECDHNCWEKAYGDSDNLKWIVE